MILTLDAYYDGFDENRYHEKQQWEVKCEGFYGQQVELVIFASIFQIKIFQSHPVLWNSGPERYFSITGDNSNISELVGELFIAHNQACGNWVDFHKLFGFLPRILKTKSENQLAVPEPLLSHYLKVFEKYKIACTLNEYQENAEELSALLFTNPEYPDNYSYGQSYVIAETFQATRCT